MFQTITHPTDLSPENLPAFEHALRLALLNKSRFTMLNVKRVGEGGSWDSFPEVRETMARWRFLSPVAERHDVLEQTGVAVRKFHLEADDVLDELIDFLLEEPTDLLVMASHGRAGFEALFHPSIATRLAHVTMMNTLVFGPHARAFVDSATGSHDRIKTVLVPVDHSPLANRALETLDALAHNLDVEFDYLHVGDKAPVLNGEKGLRHVRTLKGPVVDTILAEAEHADLIALPMVGSGTLLDALRGRTTERVIREASRPVLVVPA